MQLYDYLYYSFSRAGHTQMKKLNKQKTSCAKVCLLGRGIRIWQSCFRFNYFLVAGLGFEVLTGILRCWCHRLLDQKVLKPFTIFVRLKLQVILKAFVTLSIYKICDFIQNWVNDEQISLRASELVTIISSGWRPNVWKPFKTEKTDHLFYHTSHVKRYVLPQACMFCRRPDSVAEIRANRLLLEEYQR